MARYSYREAGRNVAGWPLYVVFRATDRVKLGDIHRSGETAFRVKKYDRVWTFKRLQDAAQALDVAYEAEAAGGGDSDGD